MAESLHHPLISYHLINQGCLLSPRFRLQPEHGKRPLRNKSRHKKGQRRNQHHHKSNPHISSQHKENGSHNGHHPCKQLGKSHEQTVRKLIHVRNYPADNLTIRMTVNIFQRKDFNFPEGFIPDIPHNMISHFIIADIHNPLGQPGKNNGEGDLL